MSCKDCNEVTLLSGTDGVGIQTIVNNGDGTFTIFLTDGSSYTTEDFSGPRGEDGANGGRWRFDSGIVSPNTPNVETFITDSLTLSTVGNISINYQSIVGTPNAYQTWATNIRIAILAGREVILQIASLDDSSVIGIYKISAGSIQASHVELTVSSVVVATGNLANTKEYAISYIINGADGSGLTTIYTGDSTIGTTRTATLTDSLTFTSGQMIRIANSTNIVEVTDAAHLPSTLAANTTYVIRGLIRVTSTITVNNDGSKIIGLDRTKDILQYTGIGTLLDITDVDFTIQNVGFNTTTTGKILDAINYTAGVSANNYGRTKVLQIFGCEFRGCYDIMTVTGFELVDLNNTLCWYTTGSVGLQFKDVRHLEMSSCELYNWYDEATGTTYSTASMIELLANGPDNVGFAVVNINSCIVHPEQTQNGININTSSRTIFGTISSNTFINVGLTTGKLFLPEIPIVLLPDYTQPATYYYDIAANQGLLNSTAGILMTMINNTGVGSETVISASGVPVRVECNNNNIQQDRVRWSGSSTGIATYLGGKQIFVSIHATLTFTKSGGGSDEYSFFIYKGTTQFANSHLSTGATNTSGTVTMTFACLVEETNQLSWYVQNNTGTSNITITDWQIVIRE